jgi:UDP-glucose 4-epimerase
MSGDGRTRRVAKSIAITGLRTFLGRRLAERLAAKPGLRLVGLDRLRPHGLAGGVEFREIDLTRPDAGGALADIFHKEDVEVVVHLAFRREPSPDLEGDHELETIGSLHLLHACAGAGVPRLVVGSTTMVYGAYPDNPNFLTEEHPLRGHPHAHCVQNRVETERIVADWTARHPGTSVTVLRPCWIVGPTYRDAVTRYLARRVVPTLMGYDPLLQLVHEDDCLDAFERAVTAHHPGVFNVVADGVVPLSTLLRRAGKRLLPVPPPILYRLRAYPSQAQTGDRPEGFYDYLRYLWVADGRRGWEAFGRPLYSTREAWMSAVSAERMRGYR